MAQKTDTLKEYEIRHRKDEARNGNDESVEEARSHRGQKDPSIKDNHFASDMMESTKDWSSENMSTGGGQPIEKGHRRTTQERVMQPRDTDGRFDYNAAAGMSRKYPYHGERNGSAQRGWGNKQKVPMFARATKVNFAMGDNGNEVVREGTVFESDTGVRFRVCADLSREEFEDTLRDYWLDEKGEGHLGNDVVFARVKGRRRHEETYTNDPTRLSQSTQDEMAARADEYLNQSNIVGEKGGLRGREDYKYRNMDLNATAAIGAGDQKWLSSASTRSGREKDAIHENYAYNATADANDAYRAAAENYDPSAMSEEQFAKSISDTFFSNGKYARVAEEVANAIENSGDEALKSQFSEDGQPIMGKVRDELLQAALGIHDPIVSNGQVVDPRPDFFTLAEYFITYATGKPFGDADFGQMKGADGSTLFDLSRAAQQGPQDRKQTNFRRDRNVATPYGTIHAIMEEKGGNNPDWTPNSSAGNLMDQYGYSRPGYKDVAAREAATTALDGFMAGKPTQEARMVSDFIVQKFGMPYRYDENDPSYASIADPIERDAQKQADKQRASEEAQLFRNRFLQYYAKFMGDREWKGISPDVKKTLLAAEGDTSPIAREYFEQLFGLKPRDPSIFPKAGVKKIG